MSRSSRVQARAHEHETNYGIGRGSYPHSTYMKRPETSPDDLSPKEKNRLLIGCAARAKQSTKGTALVCRLPLPTCNGPSGQRFTCLGDRLRLFRTIGGDWTPRWQATSGAVRAPRISRSAAGTPMRKSSTKNCALLQVDGSPSFYDNGAGWSNVTKHAQRTGALRDPSEF